MTPYIASIFILKCDDYVKYKNAALLIQIFIT